MNDIPEKYQSLIEFSKKIYGDGFIPLHAPVFVGNEKKYLDNCITSTFISSVGEYVNKFEDMMCGITSAKYAIATTSGTAALDMALLLAGVEDGDEVITQSLTFVATCNAIMYRRAAPYFLDVDEATLSLSPDILDNFFKKNTFLRNGSLFNKQTRKRISAVIVMHTFGLPARINELNEVCNKWGVNLVEDAAESLGSTFNGKHTGTFGKLGVFSFNGNKIVTSGGGGCIVTDDEKLGKLAKHLTTTAKIPHAWDYIHDQVGFNYRLPNLNAAVACAQLEKLDFMLENKRVTSNLYSDKCKELEIEYISEIKGARANYWLNAIKLESLELRDKWLEVSNSLGVMSRPIWELMHKLKPFENCSRGDLSISEKLRNSVVNLPSSVILN